MDRNSYAYKGIAFVMENSPDANHKPSICSTSITDYSDNCKIYEWAVRTNLTELGNTCCFPVHELIQNKLFPVNIEALKKILKARDYSVLNFEEQKQISENIRDIIERKKETKLKGKENEDEFKLEDASKKVKEKEEEPKVKLNWHDSQFPTNLDEYLAL